MKQTITSLAVGAIGLGIVVFLQIYHFNHPELTEMQMFQKFWPEVFISACFLAGGAFGLAKE